MIFDLRGLKCPHPTLTLTSKLTMLKFCSVLEIKVDCATFRQDITNQCKWLGKTIQYQHERMENGKTYLFCQISMTN